MELALYCPDCGYYEKEEDSVGRAGDFYTSVSVGALFGELLGFQFARWIEERGTQNAERGTVELRLVEAGAHDGRLAGDLLNWLQRQRPGLFARTEYCILEPSVRRRERQQRMLAGFSPQLRWFGDFSSLQSANRNPQFTVVLANELLDAMPVRRFGWDAVRRAWFEWGVAMEGERFVWGRIANKLPEETLHLPASPELLDVLPDGYVIEACPAAEQWWRSAADLVRPGKLVTFDYGFGAEESISAERAGGTLRSYRRHTQSDDVLANPGEQDITAHVNFGRVEAAGHLAGLRTEFFEPQGRFLTKLAALAWNPNARFGDWDAKRTRQFQTLTHPEHLGGRFRVLIQSRD